MVQRKGLKEKRQALAWMHHSLILILWKEQEKLTRGLLSEVTEALVNQGQAGEEVLTVERAA